MSESDAQMSDVADEDDIVRQHENDEQDNDDGNDNGNQDVEQMQEGYISGEDDGNENDNDTNQNADPSTATKKKITRKLIVLNTERLKGPKGVHTIEKLFQGFQFKGKGHEKEDLDRVMKRLEYWAFRLFPKLEFDDFLAKCEQLGHKKDLHVHLKKYRMGMIDADYNTNNPNDIIEEEEREDDPVIVDTERELLEQISNDNFQKLFDETTNANLEVTNT